MGIYDRLIEHEIDTGVHKDSVFFIALGGSQNYNLADENSDIDSHLFYIPSLNDIAKNNYISYEHRMSNDEHCNVKDIREYFKMFRKQNSNFIELLFTDWVVVNQKYRSIYDILLDYKEKIARYNEISALNAAVGIAINKYKHIINNPIENYNPKDTMNILRMNYFINAYINELPYKECIFIKDKDVKNNLLDIKRNHSIMNYKDDIILVEKTVDNMRNVVETYLKDYTINRDKLENIQEVNDLFIYVTEQLIYKRICKG